jgi:glycosyltransferase involved in cell wall biosynthesis
VAPKSIFALTKYGDLAASTRQRFLQFRPAFDEAGFKFRYSPLLGNDYLSYALSGRQPSGASIAKAYWRRVQAIVGLNETDLLWLQYELFPYLPEFVEKLALNKISNPVVLDLDDAIFHQYDNSNAFLTRILLKEKFKGLLRRARICICGNDYINQYAKQYCRDTIIIPTVVDTTVFAPAERKADRPLTIGWIGSPSTWHNVQPLLPVIKDITRRGDVQFLVIGAGAAARNVRSENFRFIDWREDTEVSELRGMDIGIMPLVDRPFERGKSGYKLIQYMACGLPVVASPVGVNSEIVDEGTNGFLASSPEQWRSALTTLISSAELRNRFGLEGRRRVVAHYSLESQKGRLIDLFRSL